MFQTLRNAWKIIDLRKKILYTIFIILIFRIGSAITVPFVDASKVAGSDNQFMQLLTIMSGGGFSNASLFALSITPYINASIIIQLLTVALPPLERLSKEGEAGRKKLGQITRYTTVALGLLLGVAYYFMVRNSYNALTADAMTGGAQWFAAIVIILCFTAGSALMMWLGEQINERGIGNGISVLLFAGILSSLPNALR
ncbi:MAG: preprotein translocase subunit SecY, partial [Oscillospiraceae bacterium]|nr:preprotein translocase subunit SecY [Oscillospiraceae bacterium]